MPSLQERADCRGPSEGIKYEETGIFFLFRTVLYISIAAPSLVFVVQRY